MSAPPPAPLDVQISSPASGAGVTNPLSANGTYAPGTAVVTSWVVGSDGNTYTGVVTQVVGPPPTWSATYPMLPTGSATLFAQAALDAATKQASVNIVVS